MPMNEILYKFFPEISKLYDYQVTIFRSILNKNNSLSIVPTGGGKSLVFQLAALKLEGTTIVISPLKALMMEQVYDLNERRINAIAINSDLSFQEQRELLRKLSTTCPKLIYVSPERLHNQFFRAALIHGIKKIPLVVVDEAHCISQWGLDFRPEYGAIKPFIKFLEQHDHKPTVLALTATLGAKARKDIQEEFSIENVHIEPNVIRNSLNLMFMNVQDDKSKMDCIKNFVKQYDIRKPIVYLYSRQNCRKLSESVSGSRYFHAELEPKEKKDIMMGFKTAEESMLFATTAFGMGINIPDVDGIIHHDIPGSVEEYYQHVGRAARDQTKCKTANCLMLWSDKNFDIKGQDIKRDGIKEEHLNLAFELLGLQDKKEQKVLVDENVFIFNDGTYGKPNLRLIYRLFETHGLCSTIGEINGKPRSIVFKKNTDFWQSILNSLGRRRNNYLVAERNSGFPIQEIINHIYEQELAGNIIKMPAMEKQRVIQSHVDSLSKEIIEQILDENELVQQEKRAKLEELRQLCDAADKHKFIANILGVPYNSESNS